MKRFVAVLLMAVLLSGCGGDDGIQRGMALRERLLKSSGCTFDAVITADYGEKIHSFSVKCKADGNGDLEFTVTAPETISGITGAIRQEGGNLTFDEQVLAFEMLADGQVTPVSAPWLFVKAMRSGYLAFCGESEGELQLGIDDSYEDQALHLDVWFDAEDLPKACEILWQGRRVVSLEVRNFSYV